MISVRWSFPCPWLTNWHWSSIAKKCFMARHTAPICSTIYSIHGHHISECMSTKMAKPKLLNADGLTSVQNDIWNGIEKRKYSIVTFGPPCISEYVEFLICFPIEPLAGEASPPIERNESTSPKRRKPVSDHEITSSASTVRPSSKGKGIYSFVY